MSNSDKNIPLPKAPSPSLGNSLLPLQLGWLLLGFLLLVLSLSPVIDGDGAARYSDLLHLAKFERPVDKFSSIQLFMSFPLFYLGDLFGASQAFVAYFNFSVFLLLCGAVWFLVSKDLRFWVVLLLLVASMFPHHLRYYYGEVLSVSLISVGLLSLLKGKQTWAVVLLGLGGAQVPATMPALALVLCYLSFRKRKISYLFYLILPVLLMAADNWFKYHTVFPSAYLHAGERAEKTLMPYSGLPGFSYPFVFGLLAILFSFGKGLVFFASALFVRHKIQAQNEKDGDFIELIDTLLVFTLGLVLTYSKWYGWYGGAFWGPRFFLFASIPAAMILAYAFTRMQLSWSLKLLFAAILLLSGWVCVQGYLYGNDHLAICGQNKSQLELLCWYVPEFSPVFRQFVVGFSGAQPLRLVYAAWCALSVLLVLTRLFVKKQTVNH